MKIAAISDVHVKVPRDEADKLLHAFFTHPEVKSSDYIVLLGDIFDLMCGPHYEYLQMYQHLFDELTKLNLQGKKILYFEGNHDVHLEKLFRKIWKKNEVVITQEPIVETIEGKTYYFSHGDEHETDNKAYQRYIKFIRTKPLKFVADHVMPYSLLDYIGKQASQMSRKKGSRIFDPERVRERFRRGVLETTQGKYDFVLGGHSHVKDQYLIPGSESLYLNNGYALQSKTFLLIENHVPKFVSLM